MNFIIKFIEIVRESEKCSILNLVLLIHSHPEFFMATMFITSFKKTLDERYQILAVNGYEELPLEVHGKVGGCR